MGKAIRENANCSFGFAHGVAALKADKKAGVGKAKRGNANVSFIFCASGLLSATLAKDREGQVMPRGWPWRRGLAKRLAKRFGQEAWPRGLAKRLCQEA